MQKAWPGIEKSRGGAPRGAPLRSQGEAARLAGVLGWFRRLPREPRKLPRFPALRSLHFRERDEAVQHSGATRRENDNGCLLFIPSLLNASNPPHCPPARLMCKVAPFLPDNP